MLKIKGELITDAGLLADIIRETPTRVTVKITELYFPIHKNRYESGTYQVNRGTQKYLRQLLIGQKRNFWKTGTRAGFEVGGKRYVEDWLF